MVGIISGFVGGGRRILDAHHRVVSRHPILAARHRPRSVLGRHGVEHHLRHRRHVLAVDRADRSVRKCSP